MKLIAEKNLKSSMKRLGFASFDSRVHNLIESCLVNFSAGVVSKASRLAQRSGSSSVEDDHVLQVVQSRRQNGGAETTLPLEYFGVRTSHYSENAPIGTDMAVTNANIRPAFLVKDPQGVIKGGGVSFSVPFTSVKQAVSKWGVQVRVSAQKLIQQKFESELSTILSKAKKFERGDHLTTSALEKILAQRQYQKLFKQ